MSVVCVGLAVPFPTLFSRYDNIVYDVTLTCVGLCVVSAGTPRVQAARGEASQGVARAAKQTGRSAARQPAAGNHDHQSQAEMSNRVLARLQQQRMYCQGRCIGVGPILPPVCITRSAHIKHQIHGSCATLYECSLTP